MRTILVYTADYFHKALLMMKSKEFLYPQIDVYI